MSTEMVMKTSDFLKGNIPEEIVSAIAKSERCIKTTVTIKAVENFGTLAYPDAFVDEKGNSCLVREVLSCYKIDHLTLLQELMDEFAINYNSEDTATIADAMTIRSDIKKLIKEAFDMLDSDFLPDLKRFNYKVYINITSKFVDNRFVVIKFEG